MNLSKQLRSGFKVKIKKPTRADDNNNWSWASCMDKLDGTIQTIKTIMLDSSSLDDSLFLTFENSDTDYAYDLSWLEPIAEKGDQFKVTIPNTYPDWVKNFLLSYGVPGWLGSASKYQGKIITSDGRPFYHEPDTGIFYFPNRESGYGIPIEWLTPIKTEFSIGSKHRVQVPSPLPTWAEELLSCWQSTPGTWSWANFILTAQEINGKIVTIQETGTYNWDLAINSNRSVLEKIVFPETEFAFLKESQYYIPTIWLVPADNQSPISEDQPSTKIKPTKIKPPVENLLESKLDTVLKKIENTHTQTFQVLQEELKNTRYELGKYHHIAENRRLLLEEYSDDICQYKTENQEYSQKIAELQEKLTSTQGELTLTQGHLALIANKSKKVFTHGFSHLFKEVAECSAIVITILGAMVYGLLSLPVSFCYKKLKSPCFKIGQGLKSEWQRTDISQLFLTAVFTCFLSSISVGIISLPMMAEIQRCEAEASLEHQPVIIRTFPKK